MKHISLLAFILLTAFFSVNAASDSLKTKSTKTLKATDPKFSKPVLAPVQQSKSQNIFPEFSADKLTPTYILYGLHPKKVYYSSDPGGNWNMFEFDTISRFNDIAFIDPGHLVASGNAGYIYISNYAGSNWTANYVGGGYSFPAIEFMPAYSGHPARLVMLGVKVDNSCAVFVSDDNGTTWRKTQEFSGGKLNVLAAGPNGNLVVAGNLGFKYSLDNGETWQDGAWFVSLAHINMTETLGLTYDLIYDPAHSRFVFACYGNRDQPTNINFRYSANGAIWYGGDETLDDLSEYERNYFFSHAIPGVIPVNNISTNNNGLIISSPEFFPGTYYNTDGGEVWHLNYMNLNENNVYMKVKRIMDVAWDGARFVGVSYESTPEDSKYICISTDGNAWTCEPLPADLKIHVSKIAIGYRK